MGQGSKGISGGAQGSTTVTSIHVTEVVVNAPAQKHINVKIDDKNVNIPVSPEVRAFFMAQFSRKNPTALQREKFATLMNIVRAAYKKGLADGKA